MNHSLASRPLAATLALAISLAMGSAATVIAPQAVLAAAPQQKTQAPGWYRLMLGKIEVTSLSDGTLDLPVGKLLHVPHGAKSPLPAIPAVQETSVNAWLINTGERLVLVDAGAGKLFGPTLGQVVAQIRAAGYQPEQVDDILITHAHSDHVGGLADDGKRTFVNATVHLDRREAEYWLSQARADAASPANKDFFVGAMASLNPYVQAGKVKTFDGAGAVVPGIAALSTHGHTEGHTAYVVESEGKRLVLIGDLIHVANVQLRAPDVTIAFDTDEKRAAAMRARTFAQLAKDDGLVAVSHFAFPGVGRIRPAGKGWQWVPVDYSTQMR